MKKKKQFKKIIAFKFNLSYFNFMLSKLNLRNIKNKFA